MNDFKQNINFPDDSLPIKIPTLHRTHKASCRVCGGRTHVNANMKPFVGRTGICNICKHLLSTQATAWQSRWYTTQERLAVVDFVHNVLWISNCGQISDLIRAYL